MIRNRLIAPLCGAVLALTTAVGCNAGTSTDSTGQEPGTSTPPTEQPGVPPPTPSEPAPTDPTEPPTPPVPEPGTTDPAPPPETTDPTPPATEQGADLFGVKRLYPTKAGGEEWFLADDPRQDKRFDPQDTITQNPDGSWKMRSSQVRMGVDTSTGYDARQIATYDRDVLASRGYMQSPNDWKNIEMTGFVKLNAATNTSDNFAWYARGGHHNDEQQGCEGSSYKGGLHYDGRVRWEKETWHVSYDQSPYKSVTTPLKGRWVGFKAVMRNTTVNGKEAVRLEMYLNDNADKVSWARVYDLVDAGTWGGDAEHCGGAVSAMPITWGGPIATFRWDNATDVDFKWLSVREIDPLPGT